FCDGDMKLAVGGVTLSEIVAVRAHALDRVPQRRDLRLADPPCGKRGDLPFDQPAGGEELERAGSFVTTRGAAASRRTNIDAMTSLLLDEYARPDTDFDAPRDL